MSQDTENVSQNTEDWFDLIVSFSLSGHISLFCPLFVYVPTARLNQPT